MASRTKYLHGTPVQNIEYIAPSCKLVTKPGM